jgi:catechol 2,3-dioxygenase-like lactoylglutathione lyase family enzyme
MNSLEILETCLYVDDLPAAEQFYAAVLGLAVVDRRAGRHVFFRCGHSMLLIFDPKASSGSPADVPPHGAHGPSHVAFAVSREELSEWKRRLVAHGVDVEQIVDWPNGAQSLYFRDPAGNSLELGTPDMWKL